MQSENLQAQFIAIRYESHPKYNHKAIKVSHRADKNLKPARFVNCLTNSRCVLLIEVSSSFSGAPVFLPGGSAGMASQRCLLMQTLLGQPLYPMLVSCNRVVMI